MGFPLLEMHLLQPIAVGSYIPWGSPVGSLSSDWIGSFRSILSRGFADTSHLGALTPLPPTAPRC